MVRFNDVFCHNNFHFIKRRKREKLITSLSNQLEYLCFFSTPMVLLWYSCGTPVVLVFPITMHTSFKYKVKCIIVGNMLEKNVRGLNKDV